MSDPSYPDALPAQYMLHWYVLQRVLGQGGFGITYLARDSNLDKLVAIKEYLPVDTATRRSDATVSPRSTTQNDRYASGLEGFIREARTLARFSHPNIVRVHSVFQHNNTAYMVMEYEEGETLAALLERRQTLSERELQNVVLPIIDGLSLVHAAGFIHRDIKPENILIRKDSSPVLLDFGSARSGMGQSRTVTILVAPGYAPFEQYYANGESQGPWTDIYGLGATCYRAIAGEAPLDAIARSKGVLGSTREMLVPASERGARRYSPQLLAAVDHALAFAERDRPQTLAAWKHELSGGAGQPAAAPAIATPAPAAAAAAASTPAVPRMRELLAWAGLGAALSALVIMFWQRSATTGSSERMAVETEPVSQRQTGPASAPAASAGLAPPRVVTSMADAADTSRVLASQSTPAAASSAAELPPANAATLQTAAPTRAVESRREASPALSRSNTSASTGAAAKPPDKAAARDAAAAAPAAPRTAAVPAAATLPPVVPTPLAAPAVAAASLAPAPTPTPTPASTAPAASPAPVASGVPASVAVVAAPVVREKPNAAVKARLSEAAPPGDATEVFAYQRTRALAGDAEARYRVGDMYAQGKGVAQNNNQAYVWFGLAACAGHAGAQSRKVQVAERLQPAELRQADRQVQSVGKGCQ